jgi:hypothetical protein
VVSEYVMPQAQFQLGAIQIKCKSTWGTCQKQQACAKVKTMDDKAKSPGGLVNYSKGLGGMDLLRTMSEAHQERYQADYQNDPSSVDYAHECMNDTDPPNAGRPMAADHIIDIQFGGDCNGPFQMLDSSVNSSLGPSIYNQSKNLDVVTGVSADCCPA